MPSKETDELSPVPTEANVDEPSVIEKEVKAEIISGEDTEQLSEMSDEMDNLSVLSGSKHHISRTLSSWYRRIAPLVRNKKVRVLAVFNFFLTLIAILLFLTIILLFGVVIYVKRQWGEWSECSSTCRPALLVDPPMMRRRITRIFNATGGEYAPCPDGLRVGYEQLAPCNVQFCPRRLSTFEWTTCFYHIPHIGKAAGCYKVRKLNATDELIIIDTNQLYMNCSEEDCPEFMP